MKILMVYLRPSPVSPQKNSALSVIYPGRAAEEAGHDVDYWDARLDSEKKLWFLTEWADVVAISSLSGFQLGESIRFARRVRELYPNKPLVWGGVHPTFQPVQSLREPFVDFCVIGEGEKRFPRLLEVIEGGRGFRCIDGLGYKRTSIGYEPSPEEEEVFTDPEAHPGGLVLRPIPGREGMDRIELHDAMGVFGDIAVNPRGPLLDFATEYVSAVSERTLRLFRAAANRNEVIFQASRGCNWTPTSCEFCSVGGQYTEQVPDPRTGEVKTRSRYRFIPFELWSKDLGEIYDAEPFDFVELEDENSSHFVRDWRYAEFLRERGVKYHLHLRSDQLQDEEVVSKLAATGCIRIHIGAESGNEETLRTMRKNESVADHYKAARVLAEYGIEGVYTWIIGNPGEKPPEIMDTLRVSDEVRALHPLGKSRATIYVLMPLPGTIAFNRAEKEGWPLPTTMEGWTDMSAAYNPTLPKWMNNIYFIAGFHHNRHHKTPQNFPGWWRLLILPFEVVMEWRWRQGIRTANIAYFSWFDLEYWCIAKLLSWRSQRSVGQTSQGRSQVPKLLERLMPGLAGH